MFHVSGNSIKLLLLLILVTLCFYPRLIEGNIVYNDIRYDEVVSTVATDYPGLEVTFDFYTGDCHEYASPIGHACTTDSGQLGTCINVSTDPGSLTVVCNPSPLIDSDEVQNQIAVQQEVDSSVVGGTAYYAIQQSDLPIHSSFCSDTCGTSVRVCDGSTTECCQCNSELWTTQLFTEHPGSSINGTPMTPPGSSNLPTLTNSSYISLTDDELESGTITAASDTNRRYFNLLPDYNPPTMINHDNLWSDVINREAKYSPSQGVFIYETPTSDEPTRTFEASNESFELRNYPDYIESGGTTLLGVPGFYEECLYDSQLGSTGTECICAPNYYPTEFGGLNSVCTPCESGTTSDGTTDVCIDCNATGQIVGSDGTCDICYHENNVSRMYNEGECLDVGEVNIRSDCIPISGEDNCLTYSHIKNSEDPLQISLNDYYTQCFAPQPISGGTNCKVVQSIIEGLTNYPTVLTGSPNLIEVSEANTTHSLYLNEVCRVLPEEHCNLFNECEWNSDSSQCLFNITSEVNQKSCFSHIFMPAPTYSEEGYHENTLTLRNEVMGTPYCNYPTNSEQETTIQDGYVIPFSGNQITSQQFEDVVTCDPLSETDIPGYVGQARGFCLGDSEDILMTGCVSGMVMNELTLPQVQTSPQVQGSNIVDACTELSNLIEDGGTIVSSSVYHSTDRESMNQSGCYFTGSGSCDVGFTESCGSDLTCNCADNYYGGDCSTHCEASTTCSGHGTCTTEGTCECEEEWSGYDCSGSRACTVDDIAGGCNNGTVVGTLASGCSCE